jgi:hypothetical protein
MICPRITSVEIVHGYRIRLDFDDGRRGEVDLAPFLGRGGFEAMTRDRALFEGVRVDPELGTIVWANGADMDPDVLYELAHRTAGKT